MYLFVVYEHFPFMYAYIVHICLVPTEVRKEHWLPPGTGDTITESCEPRCKCEELNLGSLQEQLLLAAGPSLQLLHRFLKRTTSLNLQES